MSPWIAEDPVPLGSSDCAHVGRVISDLHEYSSQLTTKGRHIVESAGTNQIAIRDDIVVDIIRVHSFRQRLNDINSACRMIGLAYLDGHRNANRFD
jgi:hypothetical protein